MGGAAAGRVGHDRVRAVDWRDGRLVLLDQRVLPGQQRYLELTSVDQAVEAIRDMVVRGAPAIGIAAAYGVVLAAREHFAADPSDWRRAVEDDLQRLAQARPTAVNLAWAIRRMRERIAAIDGDPEPALVAEARRIHTEDIEANRRMGKLGAALIDGGAVLTHCNAGSLATGGYGTALGVIRSAYAQRRISRVLADETRPWLQGARLTAWELIQDDIPVTLICEGAAASLLRGGEVSWVIVGADRIAANGDVANKIGTYGLALHARSHGVRFMVVAPTSTLDLETPDGAGIPIETRGEGEVLGCDGRPVAADGAEAWNPAFDVTPAGLIDALVTERGVIERPNAASIRALFDDPACQGEPI
jgi:methylthioribose-1-phosphate isomerase